MALTAFAPAKWAAGVFVRLRKALVFGSVANREFEGELAMGDRVNINEVSAVTVGTYTRYTDISFQEPDAATKTLYIDQASYAAVSVDRIDQVQSNANVFDALVSEAAYAIADTVDAFLAGKYTEAGSTVTALTVTAGNVLTNLSNFSLALDEANVPSTDRFIIIPPWYHTMALQAATGIIGHTGVPKVFDNGMLAQGFVGNLFGMNILVSNNVNNNGTVWNIMAVNRQALAYVGQIAETQFIQRENVFDRAIKMLLVYGGKTVRPNAMVSCAATKG